MSNRTAALIFLTALFALAGCAAGDDAPAGDSPEAGDVRAAQHYLATFGYLPNDELAARFPAWRPLVAGRPTPGVLDGPSAEALRLLQRDTGSAITGSVDDATRRVISMARCGVPQGMAPFDPTEKYDWLGSRWSRTTLSWRVFDSKDVTLDQARAAAAGAFAAWAGQTSLTFVEEPAAAKPDVEIHFASLDDVRKLAGTAEPILGGDMTVNTDVPWSVSTPVPSGRYDLRTVMTHELGHALGLGHSPLPSAVMYPLRASGVAVHALTTDDMVGISAIYDTWQVLPGLATDIGVGDNGAVWIISARGAPGGFGIYKWNGSDWDVTDGGAVRIAVDHAGRPWIVNSAGKIYRRTTDSPTSGSWVAVPGSATDIGIGKDSSVWVVGTNLIAGGYGIYKWNGSGWDASDGGGLRIAVGPTGVPWIVNNEGRIFRRTSDSPTSGRWQELPGSAVDIGIDDGNYAWVVGTNPVNGGYGIYTWDEQTGLADHDLDTATVVGWRNLQGGAVGISVGPNGRPWIVNAAANIYRTAR